MHSCPNCGYCPHCGRSDKPAPIRPAPGIPWPKEGGPIWVDPRYLEGPWVTYSGRGTASTPAHLRGAVTT